MENREFDYESEEIFELDLDKYGLGHLKGKNLLDLTWEEMEPLLIALGGDEISLNVSMPCKPDEIFALAATAECRQCGKCCQPNPLNPDSPGIEAFKEELEKLAEANGMPYSALEQQTKRGKFVPHPFGWTGLTTTRWLPQPCPFYLDDTKLCSAHGIRPLVCRIHPIIFTGEIDNVSIKLYCEYGRELMFNACEMMKKNDPTIQIIL